MCGMETLDVLLRDTPVFLEAAGDQETLKFCFAAVCRASVPDTACRAGECLQGVLPEP